MSNKEALDALETSVFTLASTLDEERNRLFKDIADYWRLRELAQTSLAQVCALKEAAGLPLLFEERPRKVKIWQPETI